MRTLFFFLIPTAANLTCTRLEAGLGLVHLCCTDVIPPIFTAEVWYKKK